MSTHKMPDAVILCGGAGTRLKSVTGALPKSMASVADRPFLELLFRQLERNGFQRVILAVGYQRDLIRSHFGERSFNLDVAYAVEESPLGTGGALRNTLGLIQSDTAVVMNGDSYTDANLTELIASHRAAKADMSVVVTAVDGRTDHGSIRLRDDGAVERFDEKQETSGPSYLNAGIYALSTDMIRTIPAGRQVSLERETIPGWLAAGKAVRAFVHAGGCVDIGTPERYQAAQETLAVVERA